MSKPSQTHALALFRRAGAVSRTSHLSLGLTSRFPASASKSGRYLLVLLDGEADRGEHHGVGPVGVVEGHLLELHHPSRLLQSCPLRVARVDSRLAVDHPTFAHPHPQ
eukprot:6357277-Pyramimonas_sp.AAC.1